jgi:Protein of unknown function (DUF3240)
MVATTPDCLLTVSYPAELKEELIDLLREQPQWVNGFTTVAAEGFGAGTRLHSTMEQVRGRSRRRIVLVAMASENVEHVLAALRARIPSDEVAWWTAPLSGFGRLA